MHGFLLAHLLNSWLEMCPSLCQPALFEAPTANSSWGEMMSAWKWPIWSFPCLESVCSDSFPLLIQVSQDSNYKGTGNHPVKTTISCVVWFAVPIPSVGAGVNLLPLLLLCLSVSTNQQIHWAFWHRPCPSKGCLLNCSFTFFCFKHLDPTTIMQILCRVASASLTYSLRLPPLAPS